MKATEINQFILANIITFQSVQIVLNDDKIIYGFFEFQENSDLLAKENKWCFVNKLNYTKYNFEILDGNEIKSIKNLEDKLIDYKQIVHNAMGDFND
jgi:hypothetical protein